MLDVLLGASKSKRDEKRKRRPTNHSGSGADKKKKIKVEPSEAPQHHRRQCAMNEKDKEALDRWKKFQKASHVGRNGNEEDVDRVVMIQQQQLMRRQIEEQVLVIANQQKIIHEQHEYIMTLKEQRQVLIRECQQAGLSIPDLSSTCPPPSVSNPPVATASQTFPLPPSYMTYSSQTAAPLLHPPPTHPPSQPQPSSPPHTLLSPAMTKPHPPSYASITSLPPHPPPPPSLTHLSHHRHHSVSGMLSQQHQPLHGVGALGSQHYSHAGLPPPTLITSSSATDQVPPHQSVSYTTPLGTHRGSSLVEGLTFSPLTSSEFREIDHKDQPPGYSALLMRSYDEELNSILDIAVPTGRGAGYGVGVADDELPALDLR